MTSAIGAESVTGPASSLPIIWGGMLLIGSAAVPGICGRETEEGTPVLNNGKSDWLFSWIEVGTVVVSNADLPGF